MKFLSSVSVFTAYALCSGCGLILLKMAMAGNSLGISFLKTLIVNIKFLVGFSLYVCGFLLWMYILSKFQLNVAFPIAMALFFVVTSIGSYFILGEIFSPRHVVGTLLCFVGIILVGMS